MDKMIKINRKHDILEVNNLIRIISSAFTPPLIQQSEINNYIEKLSKFAYFAEYIEEDNILGVVAYYLNDELKQLYVTMIAVVPHYHGRGIGHLLIQEVIQIAISRSFCSIGLEVNKLNLKALSFYFKHGFVIIEDRPEKFLLYKSII